VTFVDPPYVERVDGSVNGALFRWELAKWSVQSWPTTQDEQEEAVIQACQRIDLLAATQRRRRLFGGLHHFHLACRLGTKSDTVGEFLAEMIMNLAKSLEVLFPPKGDGNTRDAARDAFRELGFTDDRIEGDFIPAMVLRNQVDVAHVELGLFRSDDLKMVHAFVERAESAFREMFRLLLGKIAAGTFDVAAYDVGPARPEALATIERLRKYTPADA
jgi:hypothetical protein